MRKNYQKYQKSLSRESLKSNKPPKLIALNQLAIKKG